MTTTTELSPAHRRNRDRLARCIASVAALAGADADLLDDAAVRQALLRTVAVQRQPSEDTWTAAKRLVRA